MCLCQSLFRSPTTIRLAGTEIQLSEELNMTSTTKTNVVSHLAASSMFNRDTAAFSAREGAHDTARNAAAVLPNPNSSRPINPNADAGGRPNGDTGDDENNRRPSNGLCQIHNTEYAINQRYRHNTACHKSLKTLQQTIGEKKRPCLFDSARIFGGTECDRAVFNGICTFHWSMLNLRVGLCEQYNTHTKSDGTFQHYEMLVDVALPDRALVPIFPNLNAHTSLWDLMFGFTYATNRGLLTTKINEGAAMAYALYYMMDHSCSVEFLARSTYWIQNMTEYLMAYVFYNDELLKDVYASRFPIHRDAATTDADVGLATPQTRSHLKDVFTKNVYVQDVTFDIDFPVIQLPAGMESSLNEKDAHLVRNLPPMSNAGGGATETAAPTADADIVSGGRNAHRSVKYKDFHIFVAPLVLSLRPSSYVNDMFLYAAPPVVGVFNVRFKNSPATTNRGGYSGHSVFAIQGPVQYGVALARGNRNLPFSAEMPVCTQAYVATLGGVSNMDVNEDRIFGSELARYHDFTIPESDRLFTLG